MWQRLRAAEGLSIRADWVDWPLNRPDTREPTGSEWREHSDKCMRQAAAADITLLYVEPG
jgi:hypothetical protein